MMYRLARPLLFQLDAEDAHNLALRAATQLASRPTLARWLHRFVSPTVTPVTVAGLTFPNRVGLAAGMDKNAVAPLAWWAFGFGFVELGTVTPLSQEGNAPPRMFRRPADRAILNRMGFNNHGADAVALRLSQCSRPPFPIGISVGKNKDTPNDRAETDYAIAAAKLAPYADFISINVSSPNTVGLRELQTHEAMARLVIAVRAVIGAKPLFVKVAPELTGHDLHAVLDACLANGAAGIIATNTRATTDPNGKPCGESGRPLRELALQRVAEIHERIGTNAALIGCGGIDDIPSARAMIAAGANLIQIYTGLVYEGPFLAAKLARAASRFTYPNARSQKAKRDLT